MAAGLGTRLRPLTHAIPKPLVPVANRPIMEHILERLARDGFREVVANLHWYPDTIRDHFGDGSALGTELTYSYEETLLGTAGGVRNVREFFGDSPFVVMAGDALTDIDLTALVATHEANDWVATLAVKRVANTREYGVVVTGSDGRVQGFQEKPDPAEALSDLANCMIYVLEPQVFDHFPDQQEVDFANDVFPALLERDVPFGVHAPTPTGTTSARCPSTCRATSTCSPGRSTSRRQASSPPRPPRQGSATRSSSTARCCWARAQRSAPGPSSTARW